MSWKGRAWAVAGTVTAVEVSKEKKVRRWSSAKQQHQTVTNNVGSSGSTTMERSSTSSSSSSPSTCSNMASTRRNGEEMRNQSEESLRTIMYLSIEHLDGFSQGSDQKVDCNGVGGLVAPYNCTLSKSVVEEQLDGFQDWKSMPREPRARGPIVEAKILPDGSVIPQWSLPYCQSRYTVHSR
ncbi:Protein of unknown function wound-induced - like 5 [Theobroma cacao]|nr:Protein of unknown function wound-induced - like 5 [Theobroma cacao]